MSVNRVRIQLGDVVKLHLPISRRTSPIKTKVCEQYEEVYAVVRAFDHERHEVIFEFTMYEFGETTRMEARMSYEEVMNQTGRNI